MKKTILVVFIWFLLGSQFSFAQSPDEASLNLIKTQGDAEVVGQNDSVKISFSIITENKNLDSATSENADKTNAVLLALKKLIVKNLSIKTANYQVIPKRDYKKASPPVMVGYEVQNTIDVKIEQLDAKQLAEYSSRIIGSALENGANRITHMQFYIKEMESLENQALAEAIRKAKDRAEIAAGAAGVKIKNIVNIDTQNGSDPIRPMMMRASSMKADAESMAPPIEIGESSVRMQVHMSFEFE